MVGEAQSCDLTAAQEFIETFKTFSSGYVMGVIFNGDETCMYLQLQNTYSYTMDNNVNKKIYKKVTLLLCCSATGERLPPLFFGKFKNPR